jgi:RimJ/RimL family protein N-acetyltransferase
VGRRAHEGCQGRLGVRRSGLLIFSCYEAQKTLFDPAAFHVTETLRDGRRVMIRAQRPDDREELLAAVQRASTETLYHRFFAVKREFSSEEAHFFLDIDFVNHVALVAEAVEDGRRVIVGGCRYVVVEPGRAEVAFSVIDAYQKLGLGTALMHHIAAIGREAGLQELVADVLSDNAPMLKVFERSGLRLTSTREGSVVHVSLCYDRSNPGAESDLPLTSRT